MTDSNPITIDSNKNIQETALKLNVFVHIYGVLSHTQIEDLFQHYGYSTQYLQDAIDTPPDEDAPFAFVHDAQNDRFIDEQLSEMNDEFPDAIPIILEERGRTDIFYPSKLELEAYGSPYYWGASYAWEQFLDFVGGKKFLRHFDPLDCIELCNSLYQSAQVYYATQDDEFPEDDSDSPEKLILEELGIKNEKDQAKVFEMTQKMVSSVRLWAKFGRTLQDCERETPLSDDELQEQYLQNTTPPSDEPLRSTKIPRNAPCPCGSGKKYKQCCGKN